MRWPRIVAAGLLIASPAAAVLPGTAGAAAVPRAAVATSTTLTASSTSVGQDSWVSFTARVSASSGLQTGSVTFTDVSNGSVLDTAALSSGTAAFSTAALAVGARSIVASYSGDSTFSPSSSAAVGITVAAGGSPAVAYQVDARHSGRQPRGTLSAGSLVKKWSRAMPGAAPRTNSVSYAVIALGRVFVTVQETGTHLYALNASTGATDWSVNLGGSLGFGTPAYDGRRVFAVNYDGVVTAFVASTGHELWTTDLAGAVTAPPTAYDGVLYISGDAGEMYAMSEADGRILWFEPVLNGGLSSPAVDSTGAYVSYASQQDYRFSLGGQLVWHYAGCCESSGGSAPVLHGSYVYTRGDLDPPLILAKSTGAVVGTFASIAAPAFDSTNMYTLYGGNLVAVAPSGSPNRWSFKNGSLVTAPVVSNGVVYIGSSSGKVYGVSARSGATVWSGTAGTFIAGPDYDIGLESGITIGGGLLVVPAGNVLTVFGD
jgi:outer membrane protein assembly factor BamB